MQDQLAMPQEEQMPKVVAPVTPEEREALFQQIRDEVAKKAEIKAQEPQPDTSEQAPEEEEANVDGTEKAGQEESI